MVLFSEHAEHHWTAQSGEGSAAGGARFLGFC